MSKKSRRGKKKYFNKSKKLKSEKQNTVIHAKKRNQEICKAKVTFMVHDVTFANKKSLLDENNILCDKKSTITYEK